MIETVRLVSDGEELVSYQGETLHLHSDAAARAARRAGRPVGPKDPAPSFRSAEPTRAPATQAPPERRS